MTATDLAGEEPFDLAEPAYDVPPAFRDADERRVHVRAHNHWSALLRGRAFPSVADLDPVTPDFAANGVLLELGDGEGAPVPRYIGHRLREEAGLVTTASSLADVPSGSLLERLISGCAAVIEKRAPVGFEAEFTSLRGLRTLYRGILMPLSTDGHGIDAIYGVINWKEIAAVDLAAGLVAEMVEALAVARPRGVSGSYPFETSSAR